MIIPKIRIAHFTDLHLRENTPGTSSVPARRSCGGLKRFEEALALVIKENPDCIVVTGDLIDAPEFITEGMPRGFLKPDGTDWSACMLEDYAEIKKLLDATHLPYRVLPGNHDSVEEFHQVFGLSEELECKGYRIIPFEDYEQAGHVPRRFVPSRFRFDSVLSDGSPAPQIHLQHYLLQEIPGEGYPHTYGEFAALRAMIANSGKVRLCLSGHYHRGTDLEELEGTIYTATRCFCDAPHRWRILEVNGNNVQAFDSHLPIKPTLRPAVFLDRDGVINDLASYQTGPEEFVLIKGVGAAIRRLNENGIPVVIVTNQSAIGFGFVPEAVVRAVHEQMFALLKQAGASMDAVYYMKSGGDRSVLAELRQGPAEKAELILKAAQELSLDLSRSWMVGDQLTDLEAGEKTCGKPSILVHTGLGKQMKLELMEKLPRAMQAEDLAQAVEIILKN